MDPCVGSGDVAEVHEQRLVKRGISYVHIGGTVQCKTCDTYVRLRGPHTVPVAHVPNHMPGDARPM